MKPAFRIHTQSCVFSALTPRVHISLAFQVAWPSLYVPRLGTWEASGENLAEAGASDGILKVKGKSWSISLLPAPCRALITKSTWERCRRLVPGVGSLPIGLRPCLPAQTVKLCGRLVTSFLSKLEGWRLWETAQPFTPALPKPSLPIWCARPSALHVSSQDCSKESEVGNGLPNPNWAFELQNPWAWEIVTR